MAIGEENQTGQERIALNLDGDGLLDSKEGLFAALLKNLPNGFLVFAGNDETSAQLAGNAGANALGGNDWSIPVADGQLAAYIAIQPPQNWSGSLEDLQLMVLSGERDLDGQNTSTANFTLEVQARADGLQFLKPAPAFGTEGDKIALNLNIAMKDLGRASDTDASMETVTLQLAGLGEFAAFYIGEERVAAEWDADEKTYTIRGLTQEEVNELSVLQAAGVAHERVHVTAWTVESDGDDESEEKGEKSDQSDKGSGAPARSDNPDAVMLDGLSSVNDLINDVVSNKPMAD